MREPETASELADALDAKEISAVELLNRTLDTISARDPELRAFISLADPPELCEAASAIDTKRMRGEPVPRYAGIPIAVKDNIAVEGMHLTCGSRILENYSPPYDATCVRRLREAGLVIVGKTNMDEFGFGSSTENSAFFPTRNPKAPDRVPGGTSGGSAASVAGDLVPWALGTDTGGSVRQPASLCGTVGVRPSYGRLSRYGLVAYASSMDQIGVLTRDVQDATTLLSIMTGYDPRDSTAVHEDAPDLDFANHGRLTLGIPDEYLSDECDAAIAAAVEHVAALAQDRLGWRVENVSLPLTPFALDAYYVIASVEAAANLGRYDGVKYGYRDPTEAGYAEMLTATRTHGFGDEAKRRIMLGTFAASAGYEEHYFGRACRTRRLIMDEFASVFERVDLLLSPVSPSTAWPIGERTTDPMAMYLSDIYSVPAALAGLPACVIPVGIDDDGLPIGVQLTGPRLADEMVLKGSRAIEEMVGEAGQTAA